MITALILITLAIWIEVIYDYHKIEWFMNAQNTSPYHAMKANNHSLKWHTYKVVLLVTVALMGYFVSKLGTSQIVLCGIYWLLLHTFLFPAWLNKKRKMPWDHLGTNWWDVNIQKHVYNVLKSIWQYGSKAFTVLFYSIITAMFVYLYTTSDGWDKPYFEYVAKGFVWILFFVYPWASYRSAKKKKLI